LAEVCGEDIDYFPMLFPEKVLYASSRLTGPAADWWDSYTAAHDDADTITWAEFAT
jgi:hypothetical protein